MREKREQNDISVELIGDSFYSLICHEGVIIVCLQKITCKSNINFHFQIEILMKPHLNFSEHCKAFAMAF